MTRNFDIGQGKLVPDGKRMGFIPSDKEVVATRGVKIRTKASIQKEQEDKEREEYSARFAVNADKTMQYHQEKDARAIEVVSKYINMISDKSLVRNRGSIANDIEREIRQKIIQLALDMNNDENEEDNGKGSIVVLTAVTKVLFMYRDRLNDLEFEVQQLKREVNKLSSQSIQQMSNATK